MANNDPSTPSKTSVARALISRDLLLVTATKRSLSSNGAAVRVLEQILRQRFVVMLARVNERLLDVASLTQPSHYWPDLHEVRSGTDDMKDSVVHQVAAHRR